MEQNAKKLLKLISEKVSTLTSKKISQVAHAPKENEWRAYICQTKPHWEDIAWRVKEPNLKGEAELHIGFYSAKPSEELAQAIAKAEELSKGKISHILKNEYGIRLVWHVNLNDPQIIGKIQDEIFSILVVFMDNALSAVCLNASDQNEINDSVENDIGDFNNNSGSNTQFGFLHTDKQGNKEESPLDFANSGELVSEDLKKLDHEIQPNFLNENNLEINIDWASKGMEGYKRYISYYLSTDEFDGKNIPKEFYVELGKKYFQELLPDLDVIWLELDNDEKAKNSGGNWVFSIFYHIPSGSILRHNFWQGDTFGEQFFDSKEIVLTDYSKDMNSYRGLWNVKGVVPRNEDNWDLGFTDNNIVRNLDNPGVIAEELIEKIKNNISSNTDQIFLLVTDVIELLKSKN